MHHPTASRCPVISRSPLSGFSLVEVLVATAVAVTLVISAGHLVLVAAAAHRLACRATVATALAVEKIEQLSSLAWFADATGTPVSDTTSDLSVTPAAPAGGLGLQPSPAATLNADTPPYVDYLDAMGRWLDGSGARPAGAAYVRRWAVTPHPRFPADVVILEVLVTRPEAAGRMPAARSGTRPDDVWLVAVKVRKAE